MAANLSIEDVARNVIRGDYGNGSARKQKLITAGYDPVAVQDAVNRILSGRSATPAKTTVKAPTATTTKATTVKANTTPSYYSQSTVNYGNQLNKIESSKPGTYAGTYMKNISNTLDQYLNRPDFSYDFNADPLYQQYKDQYTQQGELAMRDTMGEAAALSGGYGNSYATSAGSQAYQGYLSQLNNVIPDLYNAAYNRYQDQGTDMLNQLNTLENLDNTEYSRNQDKINQYDTDRSYYAGQYQNGQSYDYGVYNDNRNYNLDQQKLAETVRANKASEAEQQAELTYQKQQDTANAQATAKKNAISDFTDNADKYIKVTYSSNPNANVTLMAKNLWDKYGDDDYFYDFAKNYALPDGSYLADVIYENGWK